MIESARFRSSCLAVVLVGYGAAMSATAKEAEPGIATVHAGAPLAEARRTAIDAERFDRPLDQATIRKWIEIASRCTMAEFELFLAPLSPQERALVRKVDRMRAPIVNRLRFEDLRGVLKDGGLLSHAREEQLHEGELRHTTPAVENDLFGGYDCVFASVGPPDGTPRYGDVIIRLKDSVREHGWATPFSGLHFLSKIRHQDTQKMLALLDRGQSLPTEATNPLSLGFDERLHFSHYVVAEGDWERALAFQAVLVLRDADNSAAGQAVRKRFAALLKENDNAKFWTLFIPAEKSGLTAEEAAARVPFGYLEGKFADRLGGEDFTSIEVPAERLSEVRSWPEARLYLHLIRAKRPGVP